MSIPNNDIAHCDNEKCVKKEKCLRYTLHLDRVKRNDKNDITCYVLNRGECDDCITYIEKNDNDK